MVSLVFSLSRLAFFMRRRNVAPRSTPVVLVGAAIGVVAALIVGSPRSTGAAVVGVGMGVAAVSGPW